MEFVDGYEKEELWGSMTEAYMLAALRFCVWRDEGVGVWAGYA
jgi:hypothetical protein